MLALAAEPTASDDVDAFDLLRLPCAVKILVGGHREHVLLGDGVHSVRMEVISGTLLSGAVRLHYRVTSIREAEAKLPTIHRLVALQRLGRFPRTLFPPVPQARRWAMTLAALDARRAGASQREIAVLLFGERTVQAEWRGRSDFLRRQVQRLLCLGEQLVDGGYRRLLR